MRLSILAAVLFCASGAVAAQEVFPASELTFDGPFANRDNDRGTLYCLLGAGFFRTPRSGEEDALIAAWLDAHPGASVIPVSTMGPTMQDGSGRMNYVWLVDDGDTLNVHLIRRGAFPGGVMEDHLTVARRMEAMERENPIEGVPPSDYSGVRRFVSDEAYDAFIARIVAAEEAAAAEHLGVWSEPQR